MAIGDITYNEIIVLIKNWIKSNAINISNFNAIPAQFKAGWSTGANISSNGPHYTSRYSVVISKAVNQVAATTVDNDMNAFLNSIGVASKINQNIPTSEFLNFINDIISFCSTKLGFAISQFNANRYLIYITENRSYNSLIQIKTNLNVKVIEANDINILFNAIINIIKQNIRCYPCKYNYSFA